MTTMSRGIHGTDALAGWAGILEPMDAYASLVGIESSQISMMRVAPSKSYLMYKLLGTDASVLGNGTSPTGLYCCFNR
jgi:hypothetical protein